MGSTVKKYGILQVSIGRLSGNVIRSIRKMPKDVILPNLTVETIQMMFLNVYNRFMENRNQIIEDCVFIRMSLTDFEELDKEIGKAD